MGRLWELGMGEREGGGEGTKGGDETHTAPSVSGAILCLWHKPRGDESMNSMVENPQNPGVGVPHEGGVAWRAGAGRGGRGRGSHQGDRSGHPHWRG